MAESNGDLPQNAPLYTAASNELVSSISNTLPREGRLNQDNVRNISSDIGTHYGLPAETIQRAAEIPVDFINDTAYMRILADATFEVLSDQHGIPPESARAKNLARKKILKDKNVYASTLIHNGQRRICVNVDSWNDIPKESRTDQQIVAIRHELTHELARDPNNPYNTGFSTGAEGNGINEAATQILEITDRLGVDTKTLYAMLREKKLSIPYQEKTLALLGALNSAARAGKEFTAAEIASFYFPPKPQKKEDFTREILSRASPSHLPDVQILLKKLAEYK